jgi:DUF1680 family protein
MRQFEFSKPIALHNINITDAFWSREMELVRKEVLPYQWEALNDRVEGAAPSFCMRNFKLAAEITRKRAEQGTDYKEIKYPTNIFETLPEDMEHKKDCFYGFVFQDSDFSKWIEAVGYTLARKPDEELERIADEAIAIVCAAQHQSGYLDTYYIINNMDEIFTNLRWNHELYCFGHLTEGAVAYYEATGKNALLKAAMRYADYIESVFGEEEGKLKGYPGHEIAEMALARLYETTGDPKYLKLGKYFIEERGKKPYYFDIESGEKVKNPEELRYQYFQAHLPVREQSEAAGHAVRAVYLYSGMADIARITEDESLFETCEALWNDMMKRKMYITGGLGGTHIGEAFSFAYDLPNDTAYAETCASIGAVFFARRMLQMKPDSKYADFMERALYNGILSGMALDGKSFFYVNPLEVYPEGCHRDERKYHVKPVRQKWFGCACCPPNLARLISSIPSYAFTETEDTLYVHLYLGSRIEKEVKGSPVTIEITSSLPWEGKAAIQVKAPAPVTFTLALRIPEWTQDYQLDTPEGETEVKDGYYYITREWCGQDTVQIDFPMQLRRMRANPMVREDIGKIAILRGPVVYCLEEADNGKNLHLISLPRQNPLNIKPGRIEDQEVILIQGTGNKLKTDEFTEQELYMAAKAEQYEEVTLTWIPYYCWANRGEGEMQVWIRE